MWFNPKCLYYCRNWLHVIILSKRLHAIILSKWLHAIILQTNDYMCLFCMWCAQCPCHLYRTKIKRPLLHACCAVRPVYVFFVQWCGRLHPARYQCQLASATHIDIGVNVLATFTSAAWLHICVDDKNSALTLASSLNNQLLTVTQNNTKTWFVKI